MGKKYEYNPETAKAYKDIGIDGTTYEPSFVESANILGNLSGKIVLDFGSGAGRSTKFLRNLGAEKVIGVDHNESMVKEATEQNIKGTKFYLVKDTLPLLDCSIDVAFSSWVFMEMGDIEDIKKVMLEVVRVLKPKGLFLIVVANPESVFGHDYINFKYIDNPKSLKSGDETKLIIKANKPFTIVDHYWTLKDYEETLKTAGFTVGDIIYPKPEYGNWLDETKVAAHMIIKASRD